MRSAFFLLPLCLSGAGLADELITESRELDPEANPTGRVIQLLAPEPSPRDWDPLNDAPIHTLAELIEIAQSHVSPPAGRVFEAPEMMGAQLLRMGMGAGRSLDVAVLVYL